LFQNVCRRVKIQVAENLKWICDRCIWEKVRLLQEKLQNALLEIEGLKRKNKRMEEKLRVAAAGGEVSRCDTVQGHQEVEECLVLGDSVIRNVGTELRNIVVVCFPGIRTDQLNRVVENTDFGNPDTTNSCREVLMI
jgi:hypothetical protein